MRNQGKHPSHTFPSNLQNTSYTHHDKDVTTLNKYEVTTALKPN